MHHLHLFVVCILLAAAPAAGSSTARARFDNAARRPQPAPGDTLTFDDALARIARRHPGLPAESARVAAARGGVDQAGARPNPVLFAHAENVGGTYPSFDASELSLMLSQEFELGGKRSARSARASSAADASLLDADLAILDLYLAARHRYAAVTHADERLRLALANQAVVDSLAQAAEARVRAGATLAADRLLAEVARARVGESVRIAELERVRARRSLAALWSDASVAFPEPVEPARRLPDGAPPADSVEAWIEGSAAVSRARRAAAVQRADLQVERSLRVPSLTAGAGVRRVESDGANTFLFGVSLPLPLWDRRAGAIGAAEAHVRAGEHEIEAARLAARDELLGRLDRLSGMLARLRQSLETTIPAARSAAREMETAYRIGGASYVDLLEVQRMRIDMENEVNDLRLEITEEMIEIERLAARPIEEMMERE
jgi:cobalt-zinc-cadmium efflux system outer membrane protein